MAMPSDKIQPWIGFASSGMACDSALGLSGASIGFDAVQNAMGCRYVSLLANGGDGWVVNATT